MGWVYLDDRFPEHPKAEAAGDEACWLYVCGLAYVNRNDTAGHIPAGKVRKLTGLKAPARLAQRLVAVGLWDPAEDGYQIHDYDQWNRTAIERRRRLSDRGKKGAEARWQKTTPDATSIPEAMQQASERQDPRPHPSDGKERVNTPQSFVSKRTGPHPTTETDKPGQRPGRQMQQASPSNAQPMPKNGQSPVPSPQLVSPSSNSRGHPPSPSGDPAPSAETPLVQRVTAVCRGTNRLQVDLEAQALVDWALNTVDRRILDEAIGAAANFDQPPTLPRAIAAVVAQKAQDRGVDLTPFRPPRLTARAVRHAQGAP